MQANLDEQPVGGGSNKSGQPDMDEFGGGGGAAPESDNSAPLEQRLASKNWQVRAKAFEEMAQSFKSADTKNDEAFKEHAASWKKYLADANPGSLEKCLDALNIFIDRADPKLVGPSQNDIIRALIEKCIGHTKPAIKQKALECFNMLFEVTENFDDSIDTMCESLNSKIQKVSTSALIALNSWLSNYGVKKIKIKNFFTIVESSASSQFPAVRSESMIFYKECFKWLGADGIKPFIANLKKQQQDDLEKDFEALKDQPKNLRLTRTEKLKQKDKDLDDIIGKESEESKEDVAFDLYDAVDLLTKYDVAWVDKTLELTKWNEKKAALEELLKDSDVPKIKEGDYGNISRMLKKLVGDPNVVVSQAAVKVCGNLAKGIRQGFEPSCRELAPALIAKIKEKKTLLIDEINIVLDNFMLCTNIENLKDELIGGLNDKAPTVKRNVCAFIERSAQITYIDVLQRASGDLLASLTKMSDDSDGEVRNAALTCLGIFKGRLGESAMSKFLQDLNPQKLQKVNESAQTIKPSKYDRPEKVEKPVEKKPVAVPQNKGKPAAKPKPKREDSKKEVVPQEEPLAMDEQPVGGSGGFDDKPIGGGTDDKPLGAKGGYNLDDLPQDAFGDGAGNEDQPIGKKGGYDLSKLGDDAFGGSSKGVQDKPVGGKGGYNLSDLGPDAFGDPNGGLVMDTKPKKAPPARLAAKKQQEEEKNDGGLNDAIMTDDSAVVERKPPAKKPPPKVAASGDDAGGAKPRPQTAAPKSGPTKGPVGPQIQEENVGEGLSKEEAEAKVNEVFGSELASKFEEAKWQDKVEGFKQLGEQLAGMQPDQVTLEAVVKFVKTKMKDWKESNMNIIKEAIALFITIQQSCEKVGKRSVWIIMPFLTDKLGDVKHVNNIGELLMGLSEIVTPKYVALQLIKHASGAKSPNVLKESCNILIRMTDEFGAINMPVKEAIDYAGLTINHTNPQVRVAAMALYTIMYRHVGDPVKNFLKDIKESTLKLIEEEFAKATPYKKGEFQKKRGFRGEAAEEVAGPGKKGAAGGGAGGLDDLLGPRVDISKHISGKLVPMFKDNNWKTREEAAHQVEEILKSANMRIQPTGLIELVDNIKLRMTDANKSVLKTYVGLMAQVVEALGPNCKQFAKKLLIPLIQNLTDKQSLVRDQVINCMDKWGAVAGHEIVISHGGPLISQENPELRSEMLKWMIKNNEAIKLVPEIKELVKPLVQCLSDKTPAIRSLAEEVICYVMPIAGYPAFQGVTKDMLPAVQNAMKPLLEKIKVKVGSNAPPPSDPMNASLGKSQLGAQPQQQPAQAPALQKQNSIKPTIKPKAGGLSAVAQQQPEPKQQNLNASIAGPRLKDNATPLQSKAPDQRSQSKEPAGRLKGMANTVTNFKAQEEPPAEEGIVVNFGFKDRRADYDRKNKFQLEEIKGDQLDKIKQFTQQCVGQTFCNKMYSNDFKMHIECVETFNNLIGQQPDSIKEILDIIFKWSLIKMADSSNTKFAVAVFDFFGNLLQALEEQEYMFQDFEAQILIPMLCEKTGLNNNIIKEKVKRLVRMLYPLYDRQKCYSLIVHYGLSSKNFKTQAECLDELSDFIIKFGIDYCSDKEMKIVSKMADAGDKGVRENALKFMGEAYKIIGENIWSVIGEVTPKVKGLLEGRFKNVKKGLAPSGSQTNIFQPQSAVLAREQSPKPRQPQQENSKVGAIKKLGSSSNNLMNINPASATPRSNIGGLKNFQSSIGGVNQQAVNPMSKSINQFNASNRSNDEQPQQQQQPQQKKPSSIPKKQDMMKKVLSNDQQQPGMLVNKRAIPQTQRPEVSGDFGQQVQRSSEPNVQVTKNSFAGYKQAAQQQATKNTQIFDDDDEELRILTNDQNFTDPEQDRLAEEVTKHIHQLKYADLSKRVDSLVSLNEMITQIDANKPVLVRAANDLVGAFTHVLNDIFDKSIEDIPLRFAKYFITIVLKTCSCKEIMREVSEDMIFNLAEQLLTRLLIENLDKVGESKEGELILKNLNSSMLRLLENCNHTFIFCVLFNLLRKYKDYPLMPKLPNLIIKCLLKLSKILEKLIDKLDIEKILLAIHEYLVVINHESKTQNDEMGIRIVKTVTNELVKLKREAIWDAYRVIQCHGQPDQHIYKWIQIILKSLQTQGITPAGNIASASTASVNIEAEIKSIVEELRNPEKFEQAIPKLHRFMELNPSTDLMEHLVDCSKTFQTFIRSHLDKYKMALPQCKIFLKTQAQCIEEENKDQDYADFQEPILSGLKSQNEQQQFPQRHSQPQEIEQELLQQQQPKFASGGGQQQQAPNRISEYQSKLQSIKQRNMKSGAESATNRGDTQQNQQHHQLNTSFSAMNSSLSQKWHEINKKSANTKREGLQTAGGQQQMSNTMGGFGSGNAGGAMSGLQQNVDNRMATQPPQLVQSIGSGEQQTASNSSGGGSGGATNQDLNRRLAEMKAKLQAIKKK